MKKDWQRKMIDTKMVLSACNKFHTNRDSRPPLEIIMEDTGAPEKIVWAALEREEKRGHLDCGVSLRTAWLTHKGKVKLYFLENEGN